MKCLVKSGQVVAGNTHFDTTRANIENVGAEALDFPCAANEDSHSLDPFKGNIDLEKLAVYLETNSANVAMAIMTITNNSVGGQRVSLDNIEAASNLLKTYAIPFFVDCARIAENAYLIKCRERGTRIGRSKGLRRRFSHSRTGR